MKKVGIVTVYNACNYGSFLQAYALRSFLTDNGYKTDFLKIDVDYNNVISANEGEAYAQYEKEKYQKLTEDQKCFDITEHVDETYQCCVIGSDTVWNMFDPTYENIPYFVGKEIGCKNIISYAASVSEFGLTDRTATVETIENVLSKDIDYTRVNKIIEEKKERSQNYLLSAVED